MLVVTLIFNTGEIGNQVLDFKNYGVPKHLGCIADSMHEWEGLVAEHLGLTQADITSIKTEYPSKLNLQK